MNHCEYSRQRTDPNMSKKTRCALIAHVPTELKKKIDKAARQSRRSRSAEMLVRLEESLTRFAVLPANDTASAS